MNRELAQSIVSVFRAKSARTVKRDLARFDERDWMRTRRWLHTSGLALYFIDRLMALGAETAIPPALAEELLINLEENRVRTADLFDEFVGINSAFQRSGVLYANLKGFSLAPVACREPALRYQHDLDFLVTRRDAERCRQTLIRLGYAQTLTLGDSWEFGAGDVEACTMRDLYRVRARRSVELHVVPEEEEDRADGRLSRLQLQVWNGLEFPALSECDKLLEQALHIFHHLQSEWTRTAWLLEYATAIHAHRDDEGLWREIAVTLAATPRIQIGVGLSSLVAGRSFSVDLPEALTRAVDAIPPPARLWAGRYERELVFTEHPGSKLYLLLNDVLLDGSPEWPRQRLRRLWPRNLPAKMMATKSTSLRNRVEKMRFVLRRVRFHIASGLRYKLEAARWRKFLAGAEL